MLADRLLPSRAWGAGRFPYTLPDSSVTTSFSYYFLPKTENCKPKTGLSAGGMEIKQIIGITVGAVAGFVIGYLSRCAGGTA
jgi:hypothetical protein